MCIRDRFPYAESPDDLCAARREAGVEVVLFNMPPGDFAAGERGLAALPDRRGDFRAALDQTLDYARALDAGRCHVMAGVPGQDSDRAECLDVLTENFRLVADRLQQAGVAGSVEALNRRDMPGYLLHNAADAIAVLDRSGHPNLSFQYDFYHLQIEDGDLIQGLRRLLPRVGHIQFADNPGRHEPGTGEINFPNVFAAVDAMGYDGWVGAEYLPTGRTEDSFGWFPPASG